MPDAPANSSSLILYQTEDGRTRIQCRFENETVWLTQKLMSELFQKDVRTINEHIQNIFEEGELKPESVIRKFRITAADGKGYETQHYNLDVIISVGYRVKSPRGHAVSHLGDAAVAGIHRQGLHDGRRAAQESAGPGVPDYFDELLERIRDIRASERRMYLRCGKSWHWRRTTSPTTRRRRRFSRRCKTSCISPSAGKTAPELIAARADCAKPNMGLTSWRARWCARAT